MKCLVNARNLPGLGFEEVARLARLAPAVRIGYSHFDQVREKVDDLLDRLC